ncbi:MAG: hypothetical protein ABI670_11125 [Chloroflexota bacterium]
MALAEKAIKEVATRTPERYAKRVRMMALIYIVLNLIAIAIIIIILWRVQFFITIAQRSNVETLTLAIIFILAVYYIATTFKGFVGALRMFALNAGSRNREQRKQSALKTGGSPMYACFDQAVCLENKHSEPIKWELVDEAGKLGELVISGVKATYYPLKSGINNSLFEFLADQIEHAMQRRDLDASLQITQWSSIDEDQASAYSSMVQAFQNLEEQLDKGKPIWPTVEITQEDVDNIGKELHRLIPSLRDESLLPDVEYEVEYNVPILPEPLGFMRLTRRENRADPVVTMGCAGIIMFVVMLVLVFMILLPPWIPSK